MKYAFDIATCRRLRGLLRLAEAQAEAEAAGVDAWQHAVAIAVFRIQSGLTNDDLQWLVNGRLADHRLETTRRGARRRTFLQSGSLRLTDATCFVLMPSGLRFVRRLHDSLAVAAGADEKPHWDAATGRWTMQGALVKRIGAGAATQRVVLDACQARKWASPVDNPFADMPPGKRSHYLSRVLNQLNTGQQDSRVHFSAVDKGRRIAWSIGEPRGR